MTVKRMTVEMKIKSPKESAEEARKRKKDPMKKKIPSTILKELNEDMAADLKACSVVELKKKLELNEQVRGGNKQELILRIADRFLHGNLPRCPSCHGGILKEAADGGYYCPGSFEDDEFVRCSYTADTIERSKWVVEADGTI